MPNTAQITYNNITELSTRHREILRRVVGGQDLKQIAEIMGINHQTVICIANSPMFKQEKEKMLQKIENNLVEQLSDPKQYLNHKAIKAAKKLTHLMDTSTSDNIQLASANSILDRAGAPKITRLEGETTTSIHMDVRVMKLLLVSKLEAGLIPDNQKQQTLDMLQELDDQIKQEGGGGGNGSGHNRVQEESEKPDQFGPVRDDKREDKFATGRVEGDLT